MMSMKLGGIADILGGEESSSTVLVEGEAIIAHVHSAEHVQLFAHAEEMRQLLEQFARRKCDRSGRRHSPDCRACAAAAVLQGIQDAATRFPVH